jgi:hypothetical protein
MTRKAHIHWLGHGRENQGERWDRIRDSAYKGAWVGLYYSMGHAHPCAKAEWSQLSDVLRVLEPGLVITESQAEEALIDAIESASRELTRDWPDVMVAPGRGGQPHQEVLSVRGADLAFVALSKCTGNLWMRSRKPAVSRLQTPDQIGGSGTSMAGTLWSQSLWFPEGIPPSLLRRYLNGLIPRQAQPAFASNAESQPFTH